MKQQTSKKILLLCLLLVVFVFTSFGQTVAAQEETKSAFNSLRGFWANTGYANFEFKYLVMILVGILFIFLGIKKHWEPLLLVPIGFGILVGNIPFTEGYKIGIYEQGSVLNILYSGVITGWYPPLIFLGIGAMTDFSALISNPKLILLGAAAQIGIFLTFIGAYALGFTPQQAGAIGIIGGADGPTAIFLSSKLAPELIGAIAVAAYSYMALVPLIQPPVMNLLTTKEERKIRMKAPRQVSKTEKVIFPIVGLLLTTFISPSALPLLGMLFFGNLLKESGVTERLADTARYALINAVTILLGLTVGASTQADRFLTFNSLKIFFLGALSFVIATAGGVLFAKFMNLFLKGNNKLNPLIGAAGVSAVPDSARVAQDVGLQNDKNNHLLMHAMGPNVAGVIGSAVAAGIMLSMLG
ncbi:Glutaconyl-CoA decarboxylase subunit beta [uncultured Paludibacter sp.]|uniref:Glutaconyl-CoA decarboxylase subunit beta n=1 Tax=uncultured Paludibacter sp. TaxID=497635 RepID=A0A653AC87_9BACT|nr:Glutaconyl-CoA decarboxylase subunit beta [uncultured Paludibacter sp.]